MLQTQGQAEGQGSAHAHVAQLVSEVADLSEDVKDELKLQVPLNSKNDAVYLGTVHMGSPVSQPARVVFDTGSEYLAITSVLCDVGAAGKIKCTTIGPMLGGLVEEEPPHKGCENKGYG